MTDIVIRNISWLVTVDVKRRIIRDGFVAVDDGVIVDVGKTNELQAKYPSAELVIDAKNKIVLPGLVDGHVHNVQELARGIADEVDIKAWANERVYPFESAMKPTDAYLSSLLSQLEMIKAGTTCFFDPGSYFPDQVGKALLKSGMRGVVARSAVDVNMFYEFAKKEDVFQESTKEALRNGEQNVRELNASPNGRVKGSFCLRSLYNCSDELCIRTAELAEKYDALIQTHGDGGKENADMSRALFGLSGIERMNKLGILGPRFLMIHMGGITPSGIFLMKQKGVNGVSCPVASAHHGGSTTSFLPEMLELDLNICLGSDSGSCGNFLDVVRAMNFASLTTKRDRRDARLMRPEQLIEMVTMNPAKISGWRSQLGSLEVGKKADISIFDFSQPVMVPLYNPLSNLVYCASGANADTVIVDGEVLMQNRVVKSLDEAEIIDEASRSGYAIADNTNLLKKALPTWPIS